MYYYDTTLRGSIGSLGNLERVSRSLYHDDRDSRKVNVFICATKWKEAFFAALADPRNKAGAWIPSPDNKVQIKWFDGDGDDTACPPCVVCGE